MAQKSRQASRDGGKLASLIILREEAKARVLAQIEKGKKLLSVEIRSKEDLKGVRSEFYTWHDYNQELLKRIVDTEELVDSYKRDFFVGSLGGMTFQEELLDYQEDVKYYIRELDSVVTRLELIPESPDLLRQPAETNAVQVETDNRIFIVHGHDEEAKQSVARIVERLGFEPIILHEQPNRGRTIIEKFEEYAIVGYAIVLLTPDDVGTSITNKDSLSPRARQNVVFELGFFLGKLGRNKVCALHKGEIEIPSDYSGVIWIHMDKEGAWQYALGREIKSVYPNLDLNKLF